MDVPYVFQNIYRFPKPMEFPIENFCSSVFDDVQKDLRLDSYVTELVHYKEKVRIGAGTLKSAEFFRDRKNNLEHEFLIAEVNHKSTSYLVRVERSTQRGVMPGTLWRKCSSIAVRNDTVRVAKSLDMLTTGMYRGESYPIATLRLSAAPYCFSEFCLILSMFCIFSPDYKLLGEQCYWFVDVIFQAVQRRSHRSSVTRGEFFRRAGTYASFSVPRSSAVSAKLVETFVVLAAFSGLQGSEYLEKWWQKRTSAIDFLVLLISGTPNERPEDVFSVTSEVRRRAIGGLAMITKSSVANQISALDANILPHIYRLLDHSSAEIQCSAVVLLMNLATSLPAGSPLVDCSIPKLISLLNAPLETQRAAAHAIAVVVPYSSKARKAALASIRNLFSPLASPSYHTRQITSSVISTILEISMDSPSQFEGEALWQIFQLFESSSADGQLAIMAAIAEVSHVQEENSSTAMSLHKFFAVSLLAASLDAILMRLVLAISKPSFFCFSKFRQSPNGDTLPSHHPLSYPWLTFLKFLAITGSETIQPLAVGAIGGDREHSRRRLPWSESAVVEAGVIPVLISLLSSSSAVMREQAKASVGRVAEAGANAQRVIATVVGGLLVILDPGCGEAAMHEGALSTIEAIAGSSTSAAAAVADAGTISFLPPFITLDAQLGHIAGSNPTSLRAMAIMAALIRLYPHTAEEIVSKRAIQPLVSLLMSGSRALEVAAANTIRIMAESSACASEEIIRVKAIRPLLNLLSPAYDETISGTAFAALGALAVSLPFSTGQVLVDELLRLIQANEQRMSHPLEMETSLTHTEAVLARAVPLYDSLPKIGETLVDANGVPMLVSVLSLTESWHWESKVLATDTLASIIARSSPRTSPCLYSDDVIRSVVESFLWSKYLEVRKAALPALKAFADTCDHSRQFLVLARALPGLAQLLISSNSDYGSMDTAISLLQIVGTQSREFVQLVILSNGIRGLLDAAPQVNVRHGGANLNAAVAAIVALEKVAPDMVDLNMKGRIRALSTGHLVQSQLQTVEGILLHAIQTGEAPVLTRAANLLLSLFSSNEKMVLARALEFISAAFPDISKLVLHDKMLARLVSLLPNVPTEPLTNSLPNDADPRALCVLESLSILVKSCPDVAKAMVQTKAVRKLLAFSSSPIMKFRRPATETLKILRKCIRRLLRDAQRLHFRRKFIVRYTRTHCSA
jgi:hypothetical protein